MKTHKCLDCKKPYSPLFFNGLKTSTRCDICLRKHERAKKRKTLERTKIKKAKKREKKKNSPTTLKKELDRVFSIYIRKRDSDSSGYVTCPCCGTVIPWEKSQNMHYVSRSHMNTRYSEKNSWAGCVGCNVFKHGNYPAYTNFLLNSFGAGWLQSLIADGDKIKQWTPKELRELINLYK